jgi:hypothetical protein
MRVFGLNIVGEGTLVTGYRHVLYVVKNSKRYCRHATNLDIICNQKIEESI